MMNCTKFNYVHKHNPVNFSELYSRHKFLGCDVPTMEAVSSQLRGKIVIFVENDDVALLINGESLVVMAKDPFH